MKGLPLTEFLSVLLHQIEYCDLNLAEEDKKFIFLVHF